MIDEAQAGEAGRQAERKGEREDSPLPEGKETVLLPTLSAGTTQHACHACLALQRVSLGTK